MAARILIVEDTPMNLQLATDLLEIAGYTVLAATTAEEGLAVARKERPDLVLMDLGLPGMDGLAATRELKRDPATERIPVVALTAHAMRADAQRVREAGCLDCLTKPIDTRTFAGRIAGFLKEGNQGYVRP